MTNATVSDMNVSFRRAHLDSTDWRDELSVFLIVGAVFMSSAAIQARRGHIGIEAIVGLLPARVNRMRQVIVDLASFVLCAFFSWKSWLLLQVVLCIFPGTATTLADAVMGR
jgi:TRAP-type C4-dicarboxylate transport system permease small subunit